MTQERFPFVDIQPQAREQAILVGVERSGSAWPLASSLAELERLADTAGADVVGITTQRLATPNPRSFIGSGKVKELAELCCASHANVVIFDDELSPSQQANLEHELPRDIKIIDRTALILDIFALHASSKEGRLQVRLAQNQYLLPRLRGMWAHLASNRMGGGVGSRFGEGESQLEVDRRLVRKRITAIKTELAHLSRVRSTQRESRYASGMVKVALAGYTNAGKSSLLNCLTGASVLSHDQLFATLDSTTRKLELPEGREITLTDTVGFIQKLPTTLVEAFKSTLDEISGADLILEVVDAASSDRERHIKAVQETLGEIGAEHIPRLRVFTKLDLLDAAQRTALYQRYPEAILVSTQNKEGIDELIECLSHASARLDVQMDVCIPYDQGKLVSLAHERGNIFSEDYEEGGTHLLMSVPKDIAARFKAYRSL